VKPILRVIGAICGLIMAVAIVGYGLLQCVVIP